MELPKVNGTLRTQLGWRAPMKGLVLPAGPVEMLEPAVAPAAPSQALSMGQTVPEIKTEALKLMLVPAGLGALMAYVGFRAGKTDHGIPSVLGYTLGTIGALGALASILVMAGVVKAPIPSRPSETTTEPIGQPK
jgi:hypothetical protein